MAIISTVLAITRLVAVHALLYLIVSLLAVAVVFYTMGAPLVAALEVIIYAGAIVVLFVFVVMMLNLGAQARESRTAMACRARLDRPCYSLRHSACRGDLSDRPRSAIRQPLVAIVDPKQVGIALYGPILIGVELASMLLLGALVGACHLGRTYADRNGGSSNDSNSDGSRADSRRDSCLRWALAGLLMRRNLLFILVSIEIMLNGAGVAFVAAGSAGASPTARSCFSSFWPRQRRKSRSAWRCSSGSFTTAIRSMPTPSSEMRG